MSTLALLVLKSRKTEAEQPEEQDEDEEREEEEESFVSEREARRVFIRLAASYSYLDKLPELVARLKNTRHGRRLIVAFEWLMTVPQRIWQKLRRNVRRLSDFVNIFFLGLSQLIKRSRTANIVVRVLGTIIGLALVVGFTIVLPIWRLLNAPWRFAARLLGDLGIDIPTEEE
ncbi:MAG: hypothetical protein HY666_03850 [Chloroflexi bacterium]|nr:hypothetical protein [Chloroflexota bacterium]